MESPDAQERSRARCGRAPSETVRPRASRYRDAGTGSVFPSRSRVTSNRGRRANGPRLDRQRITGHRIPSTKNDGNCSVTLIGLEPMWRSFLQPPLQQIALQAFHCPLPISSRFAVFIVPAIPPRLSRRSPLAPSRPLNPTTLREPRTRALLQRIYIGFPRAGAETLPGDTVTRLGEQPHDRWRHDLR